MKCRSIRLEQARADSRRHAPLRRNAFESLCILLRQHPVVQRSGKMHNSAQAARVRHARLASSAATCCGVRHVARRGFDATPIVLNFSMRLETFPVGGRRPANTSVNGARAASQRAVSSPRAPSPPVNSHVPEKLLSAGRMTQDDLAGVPGLRHEPECVRRLRRSRNACVGSGRIAPLRTRTQLAKIAGDDLGFVIEEDAEIDDRIANIPSQRRDPFRVPDPGLADLDEAPAVATADSVAGMKSPASEFSARSTPRPPVASSTCAAKSSLAGIEDVTNAQRAQELALLIAARRREYLRAGIKRDLHRHHADAARRGVNQHAVAFLDSALASPGSDKRSQTRWEA